MREQTASRKWAMEIRREYKRLEEAGELAGPLHPVLETILKTWERDSPKMWTNLRRLMLTEQLAQVLLARMYARSKELREAGMPVTDAREQAEREILMLEPEEPEQVSPSPLAELAELLEESRQMVAQYRLDR